MSVTKQMKNGVLFLGERQLNARKYNNTCTRTVNYSNVCQMIKHVYIEISH